MNEGIISFNRVCQRSGCWCAGCCSGSGRLIHQRDSHLNREEKEDIVLLRSGLVRTVAALEKSRYHDETLGLASLFSALLS